MYSLGMSKKTTLSALRDPSFRFFILVPGLIILSVLALHAVGCTKRGKEGPAAQAIRSFTILGLNDVYRLEGIDAGQRGGLSRFRSLRRQMEQDEKDLLVLHAGDILFPSLLSRIYKGEQMIDVMNGLDGDREAFDDRFFLTFGNHEFEKGKLEQADILQSRIEESQFTWLGTDLHFKQDETGQPLIDSPNLVRRVLTESGGIRVGIFSLTSNMAHPAYLESFDDPLETARRLTRELRDDGAEVVIGLTHLPAYQDTDLLEQLGPEGPDLLVGGHEHERQAYEVDGRWLVKADADAVSISVLKVGVDTDGAVLVDHSWELLGPEQPEPDPMVVASIESWKERFDGDFCVGRLGGELGCLDEVFGVAGVELEAGELRIRKYETNIGNWVTDLMLEAFADEGAQVAFINAGSLRLNESIPAGTEITRRHLEGLFAYPAPLRLIEIEGRTLHEVTERAVSVWSGNGWWLQIAGFAYRQDHEAQTTSDLTLLTADGPRPIAPDEKIRAVTISFLVDPALGQDGFTMLGPQYLLEDDGPDLKDLVMEALRTAGEEGIHPVREGRICNRLEPELCLAVGGS